MSSDTLKFKPMCLNPQQVKDISQAYDPKLNRDYGISSLGFIWRGFIPC